MAQQQIQKWKVLEEEDVSPSPWFPVLRHTVELQNGQIVDDYYFSPMGDVVILVALNKQHEVVLVRQYKHGLSEILIELPGGMQQKDTSIIQSALNELEEETGIKATSEQLVSLGKVAVNATKARQVTCGFMVFDAEVSTRQKLDSTEMIQVINIPAKQVLQMVKDGEIWTVDSVAFILKAALLYPEIFG